MRTDQLFGKINDFELKFLNKASQITVKPSVSENEKHSDSISSNEIIYSHAVYNRFDIIDIIKYTLFLSKMW